MALNWDDLRARPVTADQWIDVARQVRHPSELPAGAPPAGLLGALAAGADADDEPLLNLARAWPRPQMSRAVVGALSGEPHADRRERLAWLAKHVAAAPEARRLTEMIHDPQENPAVKGWLLGALERLASSGDVHWADLDSTIRYAAASGHSALRVRVPGLITALPWRDDCFELLTRLLADDDVEVLTAALAALTAHREIIPQLDPALLDRLRTHPNPWVRQEAARV